MPDSDQIAETGIAVQCPAKINWTLRVLGRRADGFHEIGSLVSPVTLYDQLRVFECERQGMILECDDPAVPTDQHNIVHRAAELMAHRADRRLALRIQLRKRIPVGGGLGGGSSDAAATLMVLNQLWGVGWSRGQLAELAGELGSDVPLFLENASSVISGRGEIVRPARLGWSGWIVLLLPGLPVPTASVYRQWRSEGAEDRPVELSPALTASDWMGGTYNMLEKAAIRVCPALGTLQQRAAELAGRPVRISGSGSSLFTAFDLRKQAESFAAAAAERLGIPTNIVEPVERSPSGGVRACDWDGN